MYNLYISSSDLYALQCLGTPARCPSTVTLIKHHSADADWPAYMPMHYFAF